ncbi:MAG: leucyl/phenylalanyl-tRNA--protein transferase [Ferruginibacter sp.]|nr:leucyl/phenylalanyl-tRNA--protein transferase [Ferruginibacter sp.]
MIFELHNIDISFPDSAMAEPDGLLAIGGDLSSERLLLAYKNGIFPWYSDDEPICWYAPPERCVLFSNKIFVSKSMQQILNKKSFTITFNTVFETVIQYCANTNRKDQDGTWITNDMQKAYINLHKMGIAKSVEVWQNKELVGGLYGLEINNVFCGESMFSKVSNASKAALIWLCKENNYKVIDCQIRTEHLISMGAEMIERAEYLNILHNKS